MRSDLIEVHDDFPPHDPERWECVDGFEDEETTNGDRAERIRVILEDAFTSYHGPEAGDERFADFLSDMLHYVHSLGGDVRYVTSSGWSGFCQEAGHLRERDTCLDDSLVE